MNEAETMQAMRIVNGVMDFIQKELRSVDDALDKNYLTNSMIIMIATSFITAQVRHGGVSLDNIIKVYQEAIEFNSREQFKKNDHIEKLFGIKQE